MCWAKFLLFVVCSACSLYQPVCCLLSVLLAQPAACVLFAQPAAYNRRMQCACTRASRSAETEIEAIVCVYVCVCVHVCVCVCA